MLGIIIARSRGGSHTGRSVSRFKTGGAYLKVRPPSFEPLSHPLPSALKATTSYSVVARKIGTKIYFLYRVSRLNTCTPHLRRLRGRRAGNAPHTCLAGSGGSAGVRENPCLKLNPRVSSVAGTAIFLRDLPLLRAVSVSRFSTTQVQPQHTQGLFERLRRRGNTCRAGDDIIVCAEIAVRSTTRTSSPANKCRRSPVVINARAGAGRFHSGLGTS